MADEAAKLNVLREQVLEQIKALLPKEQTYVDIHVPYCAGIKYLEPGGGLGLYRAHVNELAPFSIDGLPLESLVSLLDKLQAKHG